MKITRTTTYLTILSALGIFGTHASLSAKRGILYAMQDTPVATSPVAAPVPLPQHMSPSSTDSSNAPQEKESVTAQKSTPKIPPSIETSVANNPADQEQPETSTQNSRPSLVTSNTTTVTSESPPAATIQIPTMPAPPAVSPALSEDSASQNDSSDDDEDDDDDEKEIAPLKAEPLSSADKETLKNLQKQTISDEKIQFYFEDATLENVTEYIEEIFNVKFIPDNVIQPMIQGSSGIQGHKVTFKSNTPLSRKNAWDLYLTFLDLAKLTITPLAEKDTYRIMATASQSGPSANNQVLPLYFNTDYKKLPNNPQKVRYVYLAQNTPVSTLFAIAKSLSSPTAMLDQFASLSALIITDKANNIRATMEIIHEFDKDMPEAMSVIKLKHADAESVKTLYGDLTGTTSNSTTGASSRLMTQRKQPDSLYFPANALVLSEPRTNSIVLLGPKAALKKIEEFITKYVDVELDMPFSPLHVYELKYTNASNIQKIINNVVAFGSSGTPSQQTAAQYGGVRNGNQYFKKGVSVTSETTGNRLIIKANDSDYAKIVELIKQLDVPQPQVAIEVLIVDVTLNDSKALGAQLRNKTENNPLKNINFQTSGFPIAGSNASPQIDTNNGSLLGNLISLAASNAHTAGTTLLSIGSATSNGVWGMFKMLSSVAQTNIVSNPFLITTNKYEAQVSLGSTRRIKTAELNAGGQSTNATSSQSANLTVKVTPQINQDGMISMSLVIDITEFASSAVSDGNTLTKNITTSALIGNQEVLVLGGLIKNKASEVIKKVPILGDIPGFGWLFKNKSKVVNRTNLLVFISPQIINSKTNAGMNHYTLNKADYSKDMIKSINNISSAKDPINRTFFNENIESDTLEIEKFTSNTRKKIKKSKNKKEVKVEQAHEQAIQSYKGKTRRGYRKGKGASK